MHRHTNCNPKTRKSRRRRGKLVTHTHAHKHKCDEFAEEIFSIDFLFLFKFSCIFRLITLFRQFTALNWLGVFFLSLVFFFVFFLLFTLDAKFIVVVCLRPRITDLCCANFHGSRSGLISFFVCFLCVFFLCGFCCYFELLLVESHCSLCVRVSLAFSVLIISLFFFFSHSLCALFLV